MKRTQLAQALSIAFLASSSALAQERAVTRERIEITGSNIKRVQAEGALPLQIITREEIERKGITSVEQLVMQLSSNANSLDNLASNADVVSGAARGNNGATSANLRGQGANATLILLNGRRIAAHGLNGGIVDLNSIPLAAIDRIEVLKDGASAIYGTDAVGGVINFITRRDFTGVHLQAFADVTEQGGGDIYRFSATAGWGNLDRDRFNVMGSLTYRQHKALRGEERDFVNTFQVDRGLSVDTRGTPIATVFPISTIRTILSSRGASGQITNQLGPTQPGTTVAMSGGINVLDLPGGAGCASVPGGGPYDEVLWAIPSARWACAWDTGRAAMIQQPVDDTNFVGRAAYRVTNNLTAFVEATASKVETKKSFSNNQLSSSTSSTSPLFNLVYPATGPAYNAIFNAIAAVFPTIEENRGQGIAFRWRCMPCGPRELETTAKTDRILAGIEGSWGTWDYKAGVSRARSDVRSIIGSGYYFDDQFFPLLRTGVINPFSLEQTPAAIAAIEAASAKGVVLYGGEFTLTQADATVSGPVWRLPAGEVYAAAGVDVRKEKYRFQGDERDLQNQRAIFNVPFDNVNALGGVSRDIKAVYGELLIPILRTLEVSAAVRHDDYTGFGGTTNPKISFRFQPNDVFLVRGGYNTGFRVPTFNQLFNGITESQFSGATLVDFSRCPTGTVNPAIPGCESIRPVILTGGRPDLGPEESRQYNLGVVIAPTDFFSASIDYWDIEREGTIQLLDLTSLSRNFALFPDRFFRDASGNLTAIDNRWINAGTTITKGIDVNLRLNGRLGPGRFIANLDGTYLTDKKSRAVNSIPFTDEIGKFTRSGDLGLRWKHNATFTYLWGPWSTTLQQIFSKGYRDNVLPGVANGTVRPPNWSPDVDDYILYNASVTYSGFRNLAITAGIKNILDKDPPFSAAYDSNTGAGSSWEPRVADPRGRSYTLLVSYTFR